MTAIIVHYGEREEREAGYLVLFHGHRLDVKRRVSWVYFVSLQGHQPIDYSNRKKDYLKISGAFFKGGLTETQFLMCMELNNPEGRKH